MEQLLEILENLKPGVEFEGKSGLIDNGVLTSLDIVTLVADLDDEFDIDISVTDIVPENFNSAEAMMAMIQRLQDEE